MPAEVYAEYTTLEYQVPRQRTVHPPAYVFLVDTCLAEDELAACRGALSQARALYEAGLYFRMAIAGCNVQLGRQSLLRFRQADLPRRPVLAACRSSPSPGACSFLCSGAWFGMARAGGRPTSCARLGDATSSAAC